MQSKDRTELYRELFTTVTGKKVLQDILDYARVEETVFHPEPMQNAFAQGKQSVGFHILNTLKESNHARRTDSRNRTDGSNGTTERKPDGSTGTKLIDPSANERGQYIHPVHGRHIP